MDGMVIFLVVWIQQCGTVEHQFLLMIAVLDARYVLLATFVSMNALPRLPSLKRAHTGKRVHNTRWLTC